MIPHTLHAQTNKQTNKQTNEIKHTRAYPHTKYTTLQTYTIALQSQSEHGIFKDVPNGLM